MSMLQIIGARRQGLPAWPGYTDPSTSDTKFNAPANLKGMTFDGTNLITAVTGNTVNVHSGVSATIGSTFSGPGLDIDAITMANGDLVIYDADTIYIMTGVTSTLRTSYTIDGGNPSFFDICFNGRDIVGMQNANIKVLQGLTGATKQDFDTGSSTKTGITWVGNQYVTVQNGSPDEFEKWDHVNGSVSASTGTFGAPGSNPSYCAYGGANLYSHDSVTAQIYIHNGITAYAGP